MIFCRLSFFSCSLLIMLIANADNSALRGKKERRRWTVTLVEEGRSVSANEKSLNVLERTQICERAAAIDREISGGYESLFFDYHHKLEYRLVCVCICVCSCLLSLLQLQMLIESDRTVRGAPTKQKERQRCIGSAIVRCCSGLQILSPVNYMPNFISNCITGQERSIVSVERLESNGHQKKETSIKCIRPTIHTDTQRNDMMEQRRSSSIIASK